MAGSGDVEEASNASESRYLPTTAPTRTTNPLQTPDFHPFIATMLEQELGKTALSSAIPITVATFFQNSAIQLGPELHFIQILLTMGCVAIWNGLMLRKAYISPSCVSCGTTGIVLIFFAFSVLLASVIPIYMARVVSTAGFRILHPPICHGDSARPNLNMASYVMQLHGPES